MKNRKVNYVLLPAVLLVWALIFYRIFAVIKEPTELPQRTNNVISHGDSSNQSTFVLMANYRDPFGMAEESKPVHKLPASTVPGNGTQLKRHKHTIDGTINWPLIEFHGTIKKSGSNVALMKVNGKTHLIEKGKEEAGIRLLQMTPDSVIVQYEGMKKTVRK